jgi:DJ-1/PfpI family
MRPDTQLSWPARDQGSVQDSRSGSARCDVTIEQIDPDRFDGVMFVGGSGTKVLFTDEAALYLAEANAPAGQLVAAICFGAGDSRQCRRARGQATHRRRDASRGHRELWSDLHRAGRHRQRRDRQRPKSSRLFGQKINRVLALQRPCPAEAR